MGLVTLVIDEDVTQAHTEKEEKNVNTPAVQMRGEPAKRMIRCNLVHNVREKPSPSQTAAARQGLDNNTETKETTPSLMTKETDLSSLRKGLQPEEGRDINLGNKEEACTKQVQEAGVGHCQGISEEVCNNVQDPTEEDAEADGT